MKDQLGIAHSPLNPTKSVNANIELYSGKMRLEQAAQSLDGIGAVEFRWLPRPGIRARFNASEDSCPRPLMAILELNSARLFLVDTDNHVDLSITRIGDTVSGFVNRAEMGNKNAQLSEVRFDVPNFKDFCGKAICSPDGRSAWLGRADIEFDGWRLELDGVSTTDNKTVREEVKELGGFGVFHSARLSKVNQVQFSFENARGILRQLQSFLSFCCGRRTGPILPIGFDQSGIPQWCDWGATRVSPWRVDESWFFDSMLEALTDGFPRFYAACRNDEARNVLNLAISIYTECNGGAESRDAELVVLQTAFELLGWHLLKNSDKLKANQIIRELLKSCSIPNAIADELDDLRASSNGNDGPSILARTRNALVHPSKENRSWLDGKPDRFLWEVHQLGLQYLELVILHLIGYEGKYFNRLKKGYVSAAVECVPWSKK